MSEKLTQEQINQEITKLEEMRPKVRHYSAFGDDNWKKIEWQIRVLKGVDPEDAAPDQCLEDAWYAKDWMNGKETEDGSPSESWEGLVNG